MINLRLYNILFIFQKYVERLIITVINYDSDKKLCLFLMYT